MLASADRHHQVVGRLVEILRLALHAARCSPGGMCRSAMSRRTSFDASSSAWPGATSALKIDRELPVDARDAASARSRDSSRAMLSMRTGWPVADGTVSLPIASMSRRWFSSTRIFTGYCSPRLAIASKSRRRRPPSAAACCRPSTSARRGRPRARDRPPPAPRGWRCCKSVFASTRLGVCLRLLEQLLRVVVQLVDVRARAASPGSAKLPLAAAERVRGVDGRR